MPGVILPIPLEKKVPLNLPTDEDPAQIAEVSVRQATMSEQEQIADLISRDQRVYEYDENEKVAKQRFQSGYNYLELRRLQAYLTLTACNLDLPDASDPTNIEKAKPLFRFQRIDNKMRVSMTPSEFQTAWGSLPNHWVEAITNAVYEVNPQWNPSIRGE